MSTKTAGAVLSIPEKGDGALLDGSALLRLSQGDVQVFEKIFRRYFSPLLEFAYYYLLDESIAENVVQDVFVHLWTHRHSLRPGMDLKAYLYRAVKNKSLNCRRHQRIEKKYIHARIAIPATLELPDEQVRRSDLEQAIEKAIQALPEKRRIIFCLHRFEHLNYQEIADIQGISVKTVEAQISRALRFLEKRLACFIRS